MPITQEQKIATTVALIKKLLPELDDLLSYMESNGGWLPINDRFIQIIEQIKISNWANYYLDTHKFKALLFTLFIDQESLHSSSDVDEFRESVKADFTELLDIDIDKFVTPEAAAEVACILNSSDQEKKQELINQIAHFYLVFLTHIYNVLALMCHGRSICQLVTDAMSGDDIAFYNAVHIDRTVLFLPYFQQRITRAQLSREETFLRDLSYRLKTPILKSRIKHRKLWITFAMLDDEGLLVLPHDQLLDICEQIGVYGKEYGVEDVGHLRKRLADYRRYQCHRTSNKK